MRPQQPFIEHRSTWKVVCGTRESVVGRPGIEPRLEVLDQVYELSGAVPLHRLARHVGRRPPGRHQHVARGNRYRAVRGDQLSLAPGLLGTREGRDMRTQRTWVPIHWTELRHVPHVATFGPMDRDPGPLRAHISALTGSEKAGRQAELISADGPIPIASGDVLMATWWPTAYVAREAMKWNRAREFIYLIQDFEPGFYAWSTNYALASATYDFPCRAVFNERLLRAHFAAGDIGRFGPNASGDRAVAFDPSVDRRLFRRPASDHIPSCLLYTSD